MLSKSDSSILDTSGEVTLTKKSNAATTIPATHVNMDHPPTANSLLVRSTTPVLSNVPHPPNPNQLPKSPNGLINHGGPNPRNRLLHPHRTAMNVGGNHLHVHNLHLPRHAKSNPVLHHHLHLRPANGLLVQRNVLLLYRIARNVTGNHLLLAMKVQMTRCAIGNLVRIFANRNQNLHLQNVMNANGISLSANQRRNPANGNQNGNHLV